MANIAFVSPPLSGHLNPMMDLAKELQRRGHRVSFFGHRDLSTKIEGAGLALIPVGPTWTAGSLARSVAIVSGVRGMWGLGNVIADMAATTRTLCAALPAPMSAAKIDLVVSDQLEAAGGLVAAHLKRPYVTVANALPINRDPAVPPFFTPWLPDASAWAIRRNKGAEDVSDWMMSPHARVIAQAAQEWGLGDKRTCADCLSPTADLVQVVPAFDFARQQPAPSMTYVGPIRAPLAAQPPLPVEGSRGPIVFASLGTLFGGRIDIFRVIAAACHALGAQLILAHGGRLSATQIASLAGAPVVLDFAPQRAWLPQVDACVTHAGMNTVMDCMAAGVPALALPLAYDQPGIAARLAACGAGKRITGRLSQRAVGQALGALLTDGSFRTAARKVQTEIANAGGLERAADLCEHALGQTVVRA